MGDIKVFNDAGLNDTPDTVTSYNGQVARVSEFIENLQELTNAVTENTQTVQNITEGASSSLDSFKEVEENMSVDDFLAALNDDGE